MNVSLREVNADSFWDMVALLVAPGPSGPEGFWEHTGFKPTGEMLGERSFSA